MYHIYLGEKFLPFEPKKSWCLTHHYQIIDCRHITKSKFLFFCIQHPNYAWMLGHEGSPQRPGGSLKEPEGSLQGPKVT